MSVKLGNGVTDELIEVERLIIAVLDTVPEKATGVVDGKYVADIEGERYVLTVNFSVQEPLIVDE